MKLQLLYGLCPETTPPSRLNVPQYQTTNNQSEYCESVLHTIRCNLQKFAPKAVSFSDLTSCFPHFLVNGPVWDGPGRLAAWISCCVHRAFLQTRCTIRSVCGLQRAPKQTLMQQLHHAGSDLIQQRERRHR